MTLPSFVISATTILTGIALLIFKPESITEPGAACWDSVTGWIEAGRNQAVSKLTPFFPPILQLRIRHALSKEPSGFRRSYKLIASLSNQTNDTSESNSKCTLVIDWSMPKSVFIDINSLSRGPDSLVHWSVSEEPDLEAPSYSTAAKPFVLRATLPISDERKNGAVEIVIPELSIRYASVTENDYAKYRINRPKAVVTCDDYWIPVGSVNESAEAAVEMQIPVAKLDSLINLATFVTTSMGSLYLFVLLITRA